MESVLRFSGVLPRVLQKPVIWILSKFNCRIPDDAGSGCDECQNRLLTVLYPLFFLFLYTCFLILYSFFVGLLEYVSCKYFKLYLLILIGPLSFVFLEYSGRYSFYIFCLMHSFKKVFEQTPKYNWLFIKKMSFWINCDLTFSFLGMQSY